MAVADEFAARFDAALRIKRTDKAAAGPYDRLNEFVRKLQTLADVGACLTKYLAIYSRYPKDDPRSEMIFAMLAERRIKLTPSDDDFVDGLYEEVFNKKQPLSKVATRVNELEANRRNGILKVLKEARDQRQRSGSIIDPLRQMYRKAHEGRLAQSTEELYAFDPVQDEKLEKEYRQVLAAVWTAWSQAEKLLAGRSHAYDAASAAREAERLKNTGYAGFKRRFEEFATFLAGKRADDRALFQMLKWAREPLRLVTVVKGKQTQTRTPSTHPLDYEIYVHVVFAVYLNAIQHKHLLRRPEGFTAAEQAFFLDPVKPATYYSNFLNRFKLVFPGGGQTSNVDNFTKLATLYSQLILFARSQRLALVSDARALEIARKIEATPWQQLVSERFSTVGLSRWAYAQDTFARGDRIGTDIRIAHFEGTRPTTIYLELDDAPGFVFEASLSAFVSKVEIGLYKVLWENNKGLIVLIQKFFEVIGYLPVFVEAGFIGLVKQVVQDQLIAAGLEDASDAFGVDLSSLALIAPLLPTHKLSSLGPAAVEDTSRLGGALERGVTREEATLSKGLATLTGDETKLASRLTPATDAAIAKEVAGGGAVAREEQRAAMALDAPLSKQEQRMAKVADTALSREEQRMAKAADRPLTDEERRMAKAADRPLTDEERRMAKAADRPLTDEERRMWKAIEKRHGDPRMAGDQARAAQREVQVAQQAGGMKPGEIVAIRAESSGGALHTEASTGGSPRGGPGSGGTVSTTSGGGAGSTTGGGPHATEPTGGPHVTEPRGKRRIIAAEGRPKEAKKAAEAESAEAGAGFQRTGLAAQDAEIRRLILEHAAEKLMGKGGDPTQYLCLHDPVTVNGKRIGGRNTYGNIDEALEKISAKRVERGRTAIPLNKNLNLDQLEGAFIRSEPDLLRDLQNLERLTNGLPVPEFSTLAMSPARINQIRKELNRLEGRQLRTLHPDIFEAYFSKRLVQIADLTLAARDPYHMFKSRLYKRIAERMLPGYKVIAFDIKPLANGTYLLIPIR
jgi:hypothetical protein